MRRLVEYLAYRLLAAIVPVLSRRNMVWLGRRLGALFYLFSRRERSVGLENLARVYPERTDHVRILRESLRLQAVALLDALWSSRLSPQRALDYVLIDEAEERKFRALSAGGKGVLVATAHFGSWEMFNLAGGTFDFPPATVIARPVRNRMIDLHLKKQREKTGNRIVYREGALFACMGALRRGELVCSVIDMVVGVAEGGIFVDCFGTPALTSAALPLLAVRRYAPLAFLVCRPIEKGNRYVLEMEAIEVRETEDRNAEVLRLTRELNAVLERFVNRHPEAWIWSYKRWKVRPSELVGDYPSYAVWAHPHF
ncbi:MAG: lysophospholipid acyltransferase family protein [Planctomycetota bacterium]